MFFRQKKKKSSPSSKPQSNPRVLKKKEPPKCPVREKKKKVGLPTSVPVGAEKEKEVPRDGRKKKETKPCILDVLEKRKGGARSGSYILVGKGGTRGDFP